MPIAVAPLSNTDSHLATFQRIYGHANESEPRPRYHKKNIWNGNHVNVFCKKCDGNEKNKLARRWTLKIANFGTQKPGYTMYSFPDKNRFEHLVYSCTMSHLDSSIVRLTYFKMKFVMLPNLTLVKSEGGPFFSMYPITNLCIFSNWKYGNANFASFIN